MPIHLAIRAAVLSLVAAAVTLTMIVVVRSQTQPLVIVVHERPAYPAYPSHLFAPLSAQLWDCWGFNRYNRSAADPRWWCGID